MQEFGRLLLVLGVLIATVGILLYFWPNISQWPFFRSLGRLPGDIAVKREGFRIYIPLGTSLLLSLLLSLFLYWLGSGRR